MRSNAEQLQDHPVLLVDDNDTNLHILEKIVESWGLVPILVRSGEEAIELLNRRHEEGQPEPLVVTDVHMPHMDGFDMVEVIRKSPALKGCSVIVLTSGLTPGDAERCRRLNIVAHLMKPVKRSELLDAVLIGVGIASPRMVFSAEEKDPSFGRSLNLLLVEDGIANQQLAIGLLERWGHTVTLAEDGAVAVEQYQNHEFDAILMDLQMPVMDGIEATRRIRAIERASNKHVPIIAMTAHALVGDRERCIDAGMDGYVSKPIRRRELIDALSSFFEVEADWQSKPPRPAPPSTDTDETLNLDQALEIVENDRELLNAVIGDFMLESPRLVQEIGKALESGQAETLKRAAHTLKANFKSLCVEDMIQRCQSIEDLAGENRLDDVAQPFEELRQRMDVVIAQLNDFLNTD